MVENNFCEGSFLWWATKLVGPHIGYHEGNLLPVYLDAVDVNLWAKQKIKKEEKGREGKQKMKQDNSHCPR